jgi:hypothetical protein
MATSSVILPTNAYDGRPSCDTTPGEGIACRLDCLVQPRFFYGQLLTDQDLTALLGWAQDKLRLTRFRQGWGVVCGLEVRCDPQNEGRVIVGAGYAVSDCGDDIVVCDDSDPYDLSNACFRQAAACGDLRKPANGKPEQSIDSIGSYTFPEEEIRYVDLYIRYAEQGMSPQTALGRRVCGQTEICEYGRTREWYELAHTVSKEYPDGPYDDPLDRAAKLWHKGFNAIWSELQPLSDAADKWDLLKQRVGNQGTQDRSIHHFPFVYDFLDQALKRDGGPTDADFSEILFWVVQDRRNAYLAQQCQDVKMNANSGVPLARVRVRATTDGSGRQHCRVLDIDMFPPYRRPFGASYWPAPLGSVNLGQLIWRRWEEARVILADLGVDAWGDDEPIPSSKEALTKLLVCANNDYPLFAAPGISVTAQLVDTGRTGVRVVGFCQESGDSGGGGLMAETAKPVVAEGETPAEASTPAPAATQPRRKR